MEPKKYYNREEAAKYLGLGVSTLAAWASNGRQDLKYSKLGRMVRYRKEDLDAFMEKGIQKVTKVPLKVTSVPPEVTPPPSSDITILSDALLKIYKIIGEHAKLEVCNSILTQYNVEHAAKVMQACMRHLYAVTRSDEATAEIWAHKIKLMTVVR